MHYVLTLYVCGPLAFVMELGYYSVHACLPHHQGICDGAGVVVVASEEAVKKHNLTPLARLVDYSVVGVDPTIMGIGPVYAIRNLLSKTGKSMEDINLFEVYYLMTL